MTAMEREFPVVGQKRIVIRLGDLTAVEADAIVNSENHDLVMDSPDGTSVSAAIRRRGGESLAARALFLGPLKPGEAVATGAGDLPARHLIHAAVVRLRGELRWTSAPLIRRSTLAALRCAAKLDCKTVAMPAFGVGTARFPDRAAARIMIRTVIEYLHGRTPLEKVVISLLTPKTFMTFFERSLEESLRQIPRIELSVEVQKGHLQYRLTDESATSHLHRQDSSPRTRAAIIDEAAALFSREGPLELSDEELEETGRRWAIQLVPPSLRERLATHDAGSFLLRHGPALAEMPWELLHDGTSFLCRRFNMARQVLAGCLPGTGSENQEHMVTTGAARAPARGRRQSCSRLLVISDPTEDLSGAASEGRELLHLDERGEGVLRAELLAGQRATVDRAMRQLHGAAAVHFCGHGVDVGDGGWHLADGMLAPKQLSLLHPPPAIVFNNCCPPEGGSGEGTALGQAVLRAGVSAYLSAVHAPPDEAAAAFGLHFWRNVAEGASPAEAVRRAREVLARHHGQWGVSWACYVLFGNPLLF